MTLLRTMPTLSHLHLHQFRNFNHLELEFSPKINLITGPNGVGKTSVLEAIFFLAYGKSFRAKELNRLAMQGHRSFTLYGEGHRQNEDRFQLGMQRGGPDSINRINGETIKTLNPFAQILPLILLEPNSFQLLLGGSRHRRQLIDWGVFYHYPESHLHYSLVRKALKQRNQALKLKCSRADAKIWETTCIASCEALDRLRAHYLEALTCKVSALLGPEFMERHDLSLQYDRGWHGGESLLEVWEQHFDHDRRLGYTEKGPHQADLKVMAAHKPAKDILSRGQQKLLISMLKLAQGFLLEAAHMLSPIYLFDDLASELDTPHRMKIGTHLTHTTAQIFISNIEKQSLFGEEMKIINLTEIKS